MGLLPELPRNPIVRFFLLCLLAVCFAAGHVQEELRRAWR